MKKLLQTKFNENGNCFNTCIASILETEIEEIPSKIESEDWWSYIDRLNVFLKDNYYVFLLYAEYPDWAEYIADNYEDSIYIACGKAKRGFEHAVIYKGNSMIHDPHPDNSGIESISYAYIFLKSFK